MQLSVVQGLRCSVCWRNQPPLWVHKVWTKLGWSIELIMRGVDFDTHAPRLRPSRRAAGIFAVFEDNGFHTCPQKSAYMSHSTGLGELTEICCSRYAPSRPTDSWRADSTLNPASSKTRQ